MAKDLDKNEWYFEECPADELEYCWTYEYARESEYLRTIITMWRKGAKGSKIENYIEVEEELGAETSDASVYPFFPCWPDKPYLSINPKTRKEWLRRLGMPLLESAVTGEPPYGIQAHYWGKESTRRLLERFAEGRSLSFRYGSMQCVVFNLDWKRHDKELATMFGRWLKENRPKNAKAFELRGRGNPGRQRQANLKYLSVYRLRKKMTWEDAVAFLEDQGGKLKPLRTPQDWDSAIKQAQAIIRSLEEQTFIVPRDVKVLYGPIGQKILKAAGQSRSALF
jgi:hypothetical protein